MERRASSRPEPPTGEADIDYSDTPELNAEWFAGATLVPGNQLGLITVLAERDVAVWYEDRPDAAARALRGYMDAHAGE